MAQSVATLIGFGAVLLWSLLAWLTVLSGHVPPLLLNAICFALGGAVGLVWLWATRGWSHLRNVPIKVYLFGTLGLFGYHFLYFSALRMAAPAEAGLINYLWPLLIVIISGFLPGEALKRGHIIGALIAFLGAGLIAGQGLQVALGRDTLTGYLMALAAAVVWAIYSVGSRRMGNVPTAAVTVYCLATAFLSLIAHLALEEPALPQGTVQWASTILLGIGPVGLAFFVWDIGVKRGNIQLLGVASYAAPVLSTLVLILGGVTSPSWTLLIAAALITAGAALAARASAKG